MSEMEWFVSSKGTVVGPMTAELLRESIATGRVVRGMHVRDETGAWTPIEASPFASLLPTPRRKWSPILAALFSLLLPGAGQFYRSDIGGAVLWLFAIVLGYAFVFPLGFCLHLACVVFAAMGDPTK